MTSRQSLAALALAGAALVVGVTAADAQTKRSGIVVAIDVDKRTVTLEEIGVAGQRERHLVALAPSVRVVEVERRGNADTEGPGAWPGGFRETPARSLVPGDFVTITFSDAAGVPLARAIEIVRADDGDAAAASPQSGPELPPRR